MPLVNASGLPLPPSSATPQAAEEANDADPVIESSEKSFMEDVIAYSKTRPVLVDFWAPWCEPCKQYTPVLEKAVRHEKGQIRLVKVNVDDNPAIAQELGIRSLPTTMIFLQGQPVQALPGAIPADALKKLMSDLLRMTGGTSSAEEVQALLESAEQALQVPDLSLARQHFETVLALEPEHIEASAGLLRALIAQGQKDEAVGIFDTFSKTVQQAEAVAQAMLGIELLGSGDNTAVKQALAALAEQPDDWQRKYQLAEAYLEANQKSAAIDTLLELVPKKRNEDDKQAQEKLLEIFAALGFQDPLAKSGRQRLSSLLFS